jgi:hypothetical protein
LRDPVIPGLSVWIADQREVTMAATPKARIVVEPGTGIVRVKVSGDTLYNLDAIQKLQGTILGKLGCRACCSGLPILFQQEEGEFEV